MKKVFSSHSELAHVWAQQKQESGKAANMFFQGPSIFSYGHHFEIARFVKDDNEQTVVLFTTKDYSVSTSKHKNHTRRAIADTIEVFDVPDLTDHEKNIKEWIEELNRRLDTFSRQRTGITFAIGDIRETISKMYVYSLAFHKHLSAKTKHVVRGYHENVNQFPSPLEVEKANAREKKQEETSRIKFENRQKIAEERLKVFAAEQQKNLAGWLAGETVYHSLWAITPVRLRIKEERIETTQGAQITLATARRLWERLQAKTPLEGMELDHYTVDSATAETLSVGCHEIPMSEIYRLAKQLNWTEEVA